MATQTCVLAPDVGLSCAYVERFNATSLFLQSPSRISFVFFFFSG